MKVAASPRIYMWRCPKVCDGGFLSYRQPSLRGEGAPKGRIGHRRYERGWENAFQVDDLRKHPSAADAVPLPPWGRQIGGGFAEIGGEVAVVLAFVISHTTFLVAQDDETGRCAPPFSQTIKGRPAQGLTLYLTPHLCYAIRNSEPLTIHDFQETRSFP